MAYVDSGYVEDDYVEDKYLDTMAETFWNFILENGDRGQIALIKSLNEAKFSRQLKSNKAVIGDSGRSVTIYDDDDVTILHQFQVTPDKNIRTPI